MTKKKSKSSVRTRTVPWIEMIPMVDWPYGWHLQDIPWQFVRIDKKDPEASGKGIVVGFLASPKGRIKVGFLAENPGAMPFGQFVLTFNPRKLTDLSLKLFEVGEHAAELIRLAKARG
jgi:hypothetical protein